MLLYAKFLTISNIISTMVACTTVYLKLQPPTIKWFICKGYDMRWLIVLDSGSHNKMFWLEFIIILLRKGTSFHNGIIARECDFLLLLLVVITWRRQIRVSWFVTYLSLLHNFFFNNRFSQCTSPQCITRPRKYSWEERNR